MIPLVSMKMVESMRMLYIVGPEIMYMLLVVKSWGANIARYFGSVQLPLVWERRTSSQSNFLHSFFLSDLSCHGFIR